MIEDELLPKDPVDRANHKECVRRIVSVDHIESFSHSDVDTHEYTRRSEVAVLQQVANKHSGCIDNCSNTRRAGLWQFLKDRQSRHPIHRDTIADLTSCLTGLSKRDD